MSAGGPPAPVVAYNLLPEWLLQTEFFGVLAAFVAINTVAYAALSVAKMLPKVHVGDLRPGGRERRTETRSIHPDASD